MRNRILLIAFSIPIIIIAGCRSKQAVTPLRIGLVTWIGYGPFYIAQDNGYFRQNGIDVQLERIEGDAERRAALASGDLDATALTLDAMIVMRTQGIPLKTVMAIDASQGGDGIIAKQDIKTIEDLRGKQIAFPTGLPSHFFLYSVLKEHGIKMSEIKPIVMDADKAGAAFIAGQVDAAVTWEPWVSKARQSSNGHVLIDSRDEPGLIEDVLFFREDVISQRPDDIKALIRSWFEAVDFLKANPDSSAAIIGRAFGLTKDNVVELMPKVRYEGKAQNKDAFGTETNRGFLYPLYDKISDAWMSEGVISKRDKPDEGIYPNFVLSFN
jgi:NitT/TauT family transport system substrate-binding protein